MRARSICFLFGLSAALLIAGAPVLRAETIPFNDPTLRPYIAYQNSYARFGKIGEAFQVETIYAEKGLPGAFKSKVTVTTNATERTFLQIFFLPVKAFAGCPVECVSDDGSVLDLLVPRVYRPEKWGLGNRTFREIRFRLPDRTLVFRTPKNARTRVRLGHYGGRSMELAFLHSIPIGLAPLSRGESLVIEGEIR